MTTTADRTRSVWQAQPARTRPPLVGVRSCDVAVVGAGLAGLSTAVALSELGASSVVVVDAEHVAAGASGRGTGLLGPRLGPGLVGTRKRFGDDVTREIYRWSAAAVRRSVAMIEQYGLACELVTGSQLVVAGDRDAAVGQLDEAGAAADLGLDDISFVAPGQLPAHASGYRSGLRYDGAATVDPAALTCELARVAEARGVTIYEGSPVRLLRRGTATTIVETGAGTLIAGRVVVAVNAYGAGLRLTPGVVGLRVQAGASAPLTAGAAAALQGLRTEPMIEAGTLNAYYRLTSDGRVLVGGGATARGIAGSAPLSPRYLDAALQRLHPELAQARIASSWSGPIGMTLDEYPVLGCDPANPDVAFAGGCCGHGLAYSLQAGAHLARWAGAGTELALPWSRVAGKKLPASPLTNFALDRYLAHVSKQAQRRFSAPSDR